MPATRYSHGMSPFRRYALLLAFLFCACQHTKVSKPQHEAAETARTQWILGHPMTTP